MYNFLPASLPNIIRIPSTQFIPLPQHPLALRSPVYHSSRSIPENAPVDDDLNIVHLSLSLLSLLAPQSPAQVTALSQIRSHSRRAEGATLPLSFSISLEN